MFTTRKGELLMSTQDGEGQKHSSKLVVGIWDAGSPLDSSRICMAAFVQRTNDAHLLGVHTVVLSYGILVCESPKRGKSESFRCLKKLWSRYVVPLHPYPIISFSFVGVGLSHADATFAPANAPPCWFSLRLHHYAYFSSPPPSLIRFLGF